MTTNQRDDALALANALQRLIALMRSGGRPQVASGTEDALEHAEQVLAAYQQTATSGNALFTILVECQDGVWAFDDPARGLVREPFVAGADTAFDRIAEHLGGTSRVLVTFSARTFPGATLHATRLRFEAGGAWYRIEPIGIEGWLCPATLRYFPAHPEQIHLQVAAPGHDGSDRGRP